jgi:hypothetical protein
MLCSITTTAENVFRKDLQKHIRSGRSLFGLLKSLQAQHKKTDSWWVQQEFQKAWRYSTTPLTI